MDVIVNFNEKNNEKKEIKHCATLTRRKGGKLIGGVYEVSIEGQLSHKYLPLLQLKKRANVKRIDQHKKIEEYLNSEKGNEWALKVTPATINS